MTHLLHKTISKYYIDDLIQESHFSEIYHAHNDTDEVAIKLLHPIISQDKSIRNRFLREITLLKALKHPNIIPILEHGYFENHLYLIMPFVKGQTLYERMYQKPYSPYEVGQFLEGITSALQYGHSKDIVHRDLKPENILTEIEGNTIHYYLADFGLAKRPGIDQTLTAAGFKPGTPEYVAPEIIRDEDPTDPRADIYSLTVMVYELLLGRLPFEGEDFELVLAHVQKPVPRPSKLNGDFPLLIESFLLKNLSKNPPTRHRDMADYLRAYKSALAAMPHEAQNLRYQIKD